MNIQQLLEFYGKHENSLISQTLASLLLECVKKALELESSIVTSFKDDRLSELVNC